MINTNGWIKLHRKITDNQFIRTDHTAFLIFIWLLTKVNKDTGGKSVGRFWASEELGLKPTTFYQGLKRLEKKWKMLTLSSNNKYTDVLIVNWSKYQSTMTQSNDNKMTTNRQQNDTLQELRIENKKEIIKKEKFSSLKKITKKEMGEIAMQYNVPISFVETQLEKMKNWLEAKGRTYKNYKAALKNWVLKDKQNLPEPDYSEGIPIDEWMNSPNYTKPKTWEDVRREEQN